MWVDLTPGRNRRFKLARPELESNFQVSWVILGLKWFRVSLGDSGSIFYFDKLISKMI